MPNPLSAAGVSDADYAAAVGTAMGEAYGEGLAGMAAVVDVLANRTLTPREYGAKDSSLASVAYAKGQFDTWNSRFSNAYAIARDARFVAQDPARLSLRSREFQQRYAQAHQAVQGVLVDKTLRGIAQGAGFYRNPEKTSAARNLEHALYGAEFRIGNHVFSGGNLSLRGTTNPNDMVMAHWARQNNPELATLAPTAKASDLPSPYAIQSQALRGSGFDVGPPVWDGKSLSDLAARVSPVERAGALPDITPTPAPVGAVERGSLPDISPVNPNAHGDYGYNPTEGYQGGVASPEGLSTPAMPSIGPTSFSGLPMGTPRGLGSFMDAPSLPAGMAVSSSAPAMPSAATAPMGVPSFGPAEFGTGQFSGQRSYDARNAAPIDPMTGAPVGVTGFGSGVRTDGGIPYGMPMSPPARQEIATPNVPDAPSYKTIMEQVPVSKPNPAYSAYQTALAAMRDAPAVPTLNQTFDAVPTFAKTPMPMVPPQEPAKTITVYEQRPKTVEIAQPKPTAPTIGPISIGQNVDFGPQATSDRLSQSLATGQPIIDPLTRQTLAAAFGNPGRQSPLSSIGQMLSDFFSGIGNVRGPNTFGLSPIGVISAVQPGFIQAGNLGGVNGSGFSASQLAAAQLTGTAPGSGVEIGGNWTGANDALNRGGGRAEPANVGSLL